MPQGRGDAEGFSSSSRIGGSTPRVSRSSDGAFKQSGEHVEQLARLLVSEMDALKELVGSRASVPKEQVYPRFDSSRETVGFL